MKILLVRLLLFFYLSSAYLGAMHIHHNGLKSVDCKVHILVKNINSGDALDDTFELLVCEGCFDTIPFHQHYLVQPSLKGFDAHAPPFS